MAGVLPKLIYSVLLLALAIVLLRELHFVWFDDRIYIGRFDVVGDDGPDATASAAFPGRVIAAQALLTQQLGEYQSRLASDAPTDTTYTLAGAAPIRLLPEALPGMELTVQSVNVRQILTALRRGFLAPNEVRGSVTERPGSVLAAVDWARAREPGLRRFLTPNRATLSDAAAQVACSLSWAHARAGRAPVKFDRAQFCDFAAALDTLYALGAKASSPDGLDEAEAKRARAAAASLRAHVGSAFMIADIHRLRADLLDLLPAGKREDVVEAQEERVRYAMLSPALAKLPADERRLAAFALARPAIGLKDGALVDPPANWAGLLRPRAADIARAASATGSIVDAGGNLRGSGFLVAPGLVLTANFTLDEIAYDQRRGVVPPKSGRFCLGEGKAGAEPCFTLGEIVYDGRAAGDRFALVAIAGHNPVLHPPLPLADAATDPNTLTGQYAYVIGHPGFDRRIPKAFGERVFGARLQARLLMPGRLLSVQRADLFPANRGGATEAASAAAAPAFDLVNDISTATGVAGAPLIDLATGRALAMHYGGLWTGERGKFAYAQILPKTLLEQIRKWTGRPATSPTPLTPLMPPAQPME